MIRYKIAQKVGKRIRFIRKQKDKIQEEVAEDAGIHVSTLGRIERGEINPPLQTINKIAQALRVKVKEIIP